MVEELYPIRFNYINKGDIDGITKASKSMAQLSTVHQNMPRVVEVAGSQVSRARNMGQMLGTAMAFSQGGAFVKKLSMSKSPIINAGVRTGKNVTRRLPSQIRAAARARNAKNIVSQRVIAPERVQHYASTSTPVERTSPVESPIKTSGSFQKANPLRKPAATPSRTSRVKPPITAPHPVTPKVEPLREVSTLKHPPKYNRIVTDPQERKRYLELQKITKEIHYLGEQAENQATSIQDSIRRTAIGGQ